MNQWHACKASCPDAILLFRLGDFYEAFYEDAILLSKELGLTLTKRQEIPMAGVPFHSSDGYIDKLVAKGYRVAIAEQMEDPRSVKGLVKREIVRVVTPGTVVNSTLLCDKSNNYLSCIAQVGEIQALSILDLTTAEFKAMEFTDVLQLADELHRLSPKEIIVSEKWHNKHTSLVNELKSNLHTAIHIKKDWHFDHQFACDILMRHFRTHTLDGFGLKGMISAINAAGVILHYVQEELNLNVAHITSITKEHSSHYMLLDKSTQRNLELLESSGNEKKTHSLLSLIDLTETPMGGRNLRNWLIHPLLDVDEIKRRQDAIATFVNLPDVRAQCRSHLNQIRDLERLMMRIQTGYAHPRDLVGLRLSLEQIAPLSELLAPLEADAIVFAKHKLNDVSGIAEKLKKALVDTPPLRLSDGGIFRSHFHPELDELMSLQKDSHTWVANYQVQLKEETQIKTLKVGYTKAFGYYIEVSRGQSDKIPDGFERRQTLTNAERFITPQLKEFEHKMLHAEEKISALEQQLFNALRLEVASYATQILQIAQAIAQIDCYVSLADVAIRLNYVRPTVDNGTTFRITGGRHPVVEASLDTETYIPNDLYLNDTDQRLYLITGPNMAGKSTFIRQVALIAILAQIGSFVPAKEVHIGIVDKIFSRIGASDDLSRGQSTFMVEMTETANILNNATDRSLVILDEIGRGTSTYDGVSIAQAVAEYLLTEPGKMPKTLFATHYWELTAIEKQIKGAVNYNVAVHESEQGIVFLRKIIKGGTDKSYGIHVAKLAGLPFRVLKRAEQILQKLEKDSGRGTTTPIPKPTKDKQMDLFGYGGTKMDPIHNELKTIDPNQITPLEALKKIVEWQHVIRN